MTTAFILIIGAADTGRAPMAAALLRRAISRRNLGWTAESAGVVGHDGDPAEPEARDAMLALGLDLDGHTARSLTEELAATATLLLAVEAGVARVLRARYPNATVLTLGELAGRQRDIPDPFRMQVGAWLHYAGEIEQMIQAGMARMMELVGGHGTGDGGQGSGVEERGSGVEERGPGGGGSAGRIEAVERAGRLLSLAAELPGVVDWASAARQLTSDLAAMAVPLDASDHSGNYVDMLRQMLAAAGAAPTMGQLAALRSAVLRLRAPIGPADLAQLEAERAAFPAIE